MLKLICDRCGLEINLIHHLTPKTEKISPEDEQEYRFYWEISNEQPGVGNNFINEENVDRFFDRNPQEFDKWNWSNNVGTYDKWGTSNHLCKQCKDEYINYIKNYNSRKIDVQELLTSGFLDGKAKVKVKEFKEALEKDREKYKMEFFINKK